MTVDMVVVDTLRMRYQIAVMLKLPRQTSDAESADTTVADLADITEADTAADMAADTEVDMEMGTILLIMVTMDMGIKITTTI